MIDRITKAARALAAKNNVHTFDNPTGTGTVDAVELDLDVFRELCAAVEDYFNPGRSQSHCRACGAPIIWVKTPAGKKAPLDAVGIDGLDTNGQARRIYLSHFATCPRASQFVPGSNGKSAAGR